MSSIPSGGNFFLLILKPVMVILYKNDRNVRSVNLGKTRLSVLN